MIICETLHVTWPELYSAVKEDGGRSMGVNCHIVVDETEEELLLEIYCERIEKT